MKFQNWMGGDTLVKL